MILGESNNKKKSFIITGLTFIILTLILCGCNEIIDEDPFSTLPNGIKIYGDHDKVEISDLSIRTQAGGTETETLTFDHWFTPENLPNITEEGEYNWAVYNVTGQIKNIAGYKSNINITIKYYNESGTFLFSDTQYINDIENSFILGFQFIVDSKEDYFNDIEDIDFEIQVE